MSQIKYEMKGRRWTLSRFLFGLKIMKNDPQFVADRSARRSEVSPATRTSAQPIKPTE